MDPLLGVPTFCMPIHKRLIQTMKARSLLRSLKTDSSKINLDLAATKARVTQFEKTARDINDRQSEAASIRDAVKMQAAK